ncbi:MAG: gfo/Idh/MocA family oxidoreductase, partial [Methanobacteriota archaeon]
MEKKQLGLSIIGCGMIARFHLLALREVAEFRVIGACDELAHLAEETAEQHGIKSYRSLREALADPEVDVVDICLPSGLHAEHGIEAARAGKHVIVEKPIDVTLEAAQSLIGACRDAGVRLAVILQNRFSPSARRVKEAIDAGALGRLYAGEAAVKWFREDKYYASSRWKGSKRFDGGGALMNQ